MHKRANTYLNFGDSGCFKTTQVGYAARWLWKKYRKRTRLISADGGGVAPIQPYIDAGIIDLVAVAKLDILKHSPLSVLRKLAKGDWPATDGDRTTKLLPTTPEEWETVGGYAVEGLSSIGELLMEELRIRQQRIGEEAVGSFTIDGEKFSANCRGHYGFVQNEVAGLVKGFSSLPVSHVLFTAHEGRGEEEGTRESIRGPAVVGKAITGRVPSWVGGVIHADSYTVDVKTVDSASKFTSIQQQTRVREWFVRHPDEKLPGVSYPAKLRVPPDQMEKVLKRWPGGYFEPTATGGLDWLLEFEEELAAESTRALEQQMAEVLSDNSKAA